MLAPNATPFEKKTSCWPSLTDGACRSSTVMSWSVKSPEVCEPSRISSTWTMAVLAEAGTTSRVVPPGFFTVPRKTKFDSLAAEATLTLVSGRCFLAVRSCAGLAWIHASAVMTNRTEMRAIGLLLPPAKITAAREQRTRDSIEF